MTDRFAKNAVLVARAIDAPKAASAVNLEEMAERTQPLLDPGRFAPRNEEELERLARRYYFSMKLPDSYYPKKWDDRWADWAIEQGVARAYIAMLEGDAIGVGPVMAIRQIHVINGVSTMSADLMFGRMLSTRVLRRDDFTLKADKTQCEIVIGVLTRKPENRLVILAKYEDFKHLHGKDNWRNDPEGMLVARAKSRACKRHAPDLFVGLYSREEMQDLVDDVRAGAAIVPDEFMPQPSSEPPVEAPKATATSVSTPENAPAKPAPTRAELSARWEALAKQIGAVGEQVTIEQLEALKAEFLDFPKAGNHEGRCAIWNANEVLRGFWVAS
jgi:hypothetical protein